MSMLHDKTGNRKYLTAEERNRFIEAAQRQPFPINTFCLSLAYNGARISEVLALKASSVDPSADIIVFESLKKRQRGVYGRLPAWLSNVRSGQARPVQEKRKGTQVPAGYEHVDYSFRLS